MGLLTSFLFLDTSDAKLFLGRWRPQLVGGDLVSISGINPYANARIKLNSPSCVGMLVNIRNAGYVVYKSSHKSYQIACCVWPTNAPSLEEIRDLRHWCDCVIPEVSLDGKLLKGTLEGELWDLAVIDS